MFKASISRQLLITFTTITTIGGLTLFLIAGQMLQDATLESYKRDVLTEAVTLTGTLSGRDDDEDERDLSVPLGQYALQRVESEPDWRFYIIDHHNQVIFNNTPEETSILRLDLRTPEIQSALMGNAAQAIRTDQDGSTNLYSSAAIRSEHNKIRAVLWLIVPMQPAYDLANQRWLQLAAILLPVIGVIIIASLWIGQTLTRPLRQLQTAAQRITAGHLNERIIMNRQDEIGQLATVFNTMLDSLNALMMAQRSFVSNAAHELRAPLMSMKLRIEALSGSTIPDEERKTYLNEAVDEIQHMSDLVTALLTLARLDEGTHSTRHETFDTAAFLHDTARAWRIRSAQVGLVFESDIPDGLPDIALNAADLRIVLDNLLGNALKYTPPGGHVRLSACAEADGLRLEVRDSGEGLTPDVIPHLFERFYRANLDRNKALPGNGLGLAIVDALIKQNGGIIRASSDGKGKGSTFTVIVPLDQTVLAPHLEKSP